MAAPMWAAVQPGSNATLPARVFEQDRTGDTWFFSSLLCRLQPSPVVAVRLFPERNLVVPTAGDDQRAAWTFLRSYYVSQAHATASTRDKRMTSAEGP